MSDADAARRALAAAAEDRADEVARRWLELGVDGPTYDNVEPAHEQAGLRESWLSPLARLLGPALRGSPAHRAVYLDQRTGFVPEGSTAAERVALIAEHLPVELPAIAALLAGPAVTAADAEQLLAELHAPLVQPPEPGDLRVLLIGDCVMPDIRLFLPEAVRRQAGVGVDAEHVGFNAGWRTLEPEDIARRATVVPPALIGLSLFTYEGIPAYRALVEDARRLRGQALRDRVADCVAVLGATLEAIREATDAPVLVHAVCGMPIGARRLRARFVPAQWPSRGRLIREMTAQVAALVDATENAILLDEDALVREAGGLRAVAGPVLGPEYAGAWFHPSRFGPQLAGAYADVLGSVALLGRAKVLLVDLDNTLWQGVMADGPVVHDLDGQRLLRQLRDAGVLLVALSKNDPANIRWEEMALEPEDFVLHKVDWRPKPQGVSEAVAELDLAPGAFVLLDDNPAERALVEENVPGVRSLDPADPAAWRSLRRWLELPSTTQTEEARRRTEMYREAASRRQAMGGEHDYAAMMASLELRAELRPADVRDLERVVELVQRTNQFNTTTRRRTAAEVRALLDDADVDVHVASLGDRFGDLGVVAVSIVERRPEGSEVDAFVMSCRAMGFGLEQLVLAELVAGRPDVPWTGRFTPTDRNGPAAGLFAAAGFAEQDAGRWVLAPGGPGPDRPPWFAAAQISGVSGPSVSR